MVTRLFIIVVLSAAVLCIVGAVSDESIAAFLVLEVRLAVLS
jgi:hypothetical protein